MTAMGQDGRKHRPAKSRHKGWVLASLLALALISTASYLALAFGREFARPLGPTLAPLEPPPTVAVPSQEPSQPVQSAFGASIAPTPTAMGAEATKESTPTATPAPKCGGPSAMVLLLVGADTKDGYYYGLADSIRAVRIDFVEPRITVLAFPRDLWVSIPGLADRGITHGKVNQAYFYGNLYNQPGGGPSLLAQTLQVNFGLGVDHYVAINESVFVSAINRLGGIDLYLPGRANGTWVGLPYSPSGWYHFTGQKALEFASIRMPDSDWQRIDRQNQVLMAMAEKARQPQKLPQVLGIVFSLLDQTLTDLSKADISRLFCLLPLIDRQDVYVAKIEPAMVTATINERGAYVMIPHAEVKALVADFMAGTLGEEGP